jgi:hypothetical protein
MKKVKIMLMSMAVLAIIGGALAFKARFTQTYCTLTAIPVIGGTYTFDGTKKCVEIKNVTTTTDELNPVFYTVKPAVTCGNIAVTCTTFAYTKADGGAN